jgi:hypothetical protein
MAYWDICKAALDNKFYDARIQMGPWGCLCEDCFIEHGTGLGLGRGQRFEISATGRFEKTGG